MTAQIRPQPGRHQGFLRCYVEPTPEGPVYTDKYGERVDFEAWRATGAPFIVFEKWLRGKNDEV